MSADISDKIFEFLNQHHVWVKRLISLLLLLLAIFLASKLVNIIYLFLPQYQVQAPVLVSDVSSANQTQESIALSNQLAKAHLFGQYVEEVVEPEPVAVEDAPETKLRLELLGVWADPIPELSSAVIAEKGRSNQLVYFIEDELPGDAILKQVHADKVIIERKGQLETLKFEEIETGGFTRDEPEPQRQVAKKTNAKRQNPLINKARSINSAANSIERYTDELSTLPPRQLFDRVQDALKEDPQEFMDNIGLVSSSEGGYEVSKLVPPNVAKAYGLEPGDRIISVNGKSVGNPAEDAHILDEVKSNGEATIQIQRGRSVTTVSLPIIF